MARRAGRTDLDAASVWHPAVIWRNLGEMVGTLGYHHRAGADAAVHRLGDLAGDAAGGDDGGGAVSGRTGRLAALDGDCVSASRVLLVIRPGLEGFRARRALVGSGGDRA